MNFVRSWWLVSAVTLCGLLTSFGQTVSLRTNYFKVSGTNFHEIRRALVKARPWREPFDAFTTWHVTWKFATTSSAAGCRCSGFTTVTTIMMTMPRWIAPTNATSETKERWNRFYQNLTEHELGHVRIALAANSEVRKQLSAFTSDAACDSLVARMNEAGNRVVAEHRERERNYDRQTRHGAVPGL